MKPCNLATLKLVLGAVAQLGERLVCNQEATGSIPVSSTNTQSLVLDYWSLDKGLSMLRSRKSTTLVVPYGARFDGLQPLRFALEFGEAVGEKVDLDH